MTHFHCSIPSSVKFKNGKFPHYASGVVIHPRTIIGDDFVIYQNVTIGSRNGFGPPNIGDNVLIGSGACILGKISIGDNVQIGSNAVVIHDIPSNSTAVGIPAKILQNKKK